MKRRKLMFVKPILVGLIIILALGIYAIRSKNKSKNRNEDNANTTQIDLNKIKKDDSNKVSIDSKFKISTRASGMFKRIPIDKSNPFVHLEKSTVRTEEEKVKIAQLPELLQESVQKYPEAKNEILKYFTWKTNPKNYDLTGVYKKGDIPRFIQWDSRWGFEPIGDSYMAHSACGPVAMSSVYIHFTGDNKMNPVEMSRWAVKEGYYINDFGTSGYIFEEGAKKLGLSSHIIPFKLEDIKRSIDNGDLLVLHVKKGDFTYGGHYIMLIDYDKDDKLIIHDVNSPNNSKKKWTYDRLVKQVTTAWAINE